MAGDRSGSLTGSARQAPSLGPLFRARPHPGRCAGTSKVCGHPSAPCAAASALRHWPPRRGAAGYGPPLLRGFACRLRRHQRTAPVPVSARLARAIAACARPSLRRRPGPPLASLRPMGGSDGSGTRSSGRPRAAPGGPMAHPPHHSGLPPGPSAPKPRWVPPGRPRPRPALPRPSVGWPLWAGCGLRSSRLGPGAAQGAAFFGPPAPGDGSRYSQGEYI